MSHVRRFLALTVVTAALLAGCAHGPLGRGMSGSALRFASEASAVKTIAFEEDFLDARLVFQALPFGSKERTALRSKLVSYLVTPLATFDLERLHRDPSYLQSSDDYDRLFESLHDALDLYAPAELWTKGG